MKELSVENQIYLCKYHDIDDNIGATMHLSNKEIDETLKKLKDNGLYEQYRKMDDETWEKRLKEEKHKSKEIKILDKYNFETSKTNCIILGQVLKECMKYDASKRIKYSSSL